MAIEEVEVYEYAAGTIVDPKSDTRMVFIPSPPTQMEQKINPRPVLILFGENDIEAVKAMADEQKLFVMIPNGTDEDTIEATHSAIEKGAKKYNIKKAEISVKTTGDIAAAQAVVDYLNDELDCDVADATAL